ncbi:glycosyl hydrolase family 28-related protein [Pseudomonas petrae]|uniref:Rhamnogalacturonase A/B/Epimerase-like pectate lyase domain-containing protein n=1 Tax=Pseudomonas petrae TaxID=2912190 RepID=A0ABS9I6R7_9PSED|nr:glycosyl hydrolase family 28-related protein [Pseudomonas petrae]MCF7535515.1 hypothetical protein [Pseudomonas petrae]MCF7540542.1 hypothetical protein [Pseudomonas petrae]MCF7543107.1 hypothetical protein [Pseudomonas petrae]MCF7558856.1 hypothetical protein [Pseudomonas petrae]
MLYNQITLWPAKGASLSTLGSVRKLCTEQLPTKNDLIVKFFNIENYGAVGNGRTDDTEALQSAIDAAVSFGVKLFIPTGGFQNINDTLKL